MKSHNDDDDDVDHVLYGQQQSALVGSHFLSIPDHHHLEGIDGLL